MIKINLLPENLREVEHTPYPRLITIFISLIFFLFLSYLSVLAAIEVSQLKSNIISKDEEITQKKPEVKIVELLKKEIKDKRKRDEVLKKIVASKIMWVRKLDEFNKLVSDGPYKGKLWFDGVYIAATKSKIDFSPDSQLIMKLTAQGHLMTDSNEKVATKLGELQEHLRSTKNSFGSNIDQSKFKITHYAVEPKPDINKSIVSFPLEIFFLPKTLLPTKKAKAKK
ncbi:MAG: hypothetical protein COA79_16830 [Planctomycetota bacterium]|nr:MAG: hypothetical protein COA79_16830 [Planctomycetota bacterium]